MSDELARPLPTEARLSLGNHSAAIATAEHLRFQLDHALARDAVHTPLDLGMLLDGLRARGLAPLTLHSAAPDRKTYLRRPDLGRKLHADSAAALTTWVTRELASRPEFAAFGDRAARAGGEVSATPRVAIMLADGLSSLALERHALPLLDAALPLVTGHLSLVTVLTNARVALADQIGELLHADLTVLLIGERPGLSSPDSLGVYLTWNPRPGRTDAERNCISNVRGGGLSYTEAAHRIAHYIAEATRLQVTGTILKDPATNPSLPAWLACS